jgi:hypothetical protein
VAGAMRQLSKPKEGKTSNLLVAASKNEPTTGGLNSAIREGST